MKWRKKPVVIDAVQYTGDNAIEIEKFTNNQAYSTMTAKNSMVIMTLEGNMYADVNDYIIKGIKGEFYPCKPDIFEATYEKVEQQAVDRWGLTPDDMKGYTANTGLRD